MHRATLPSNTLDSLHPFQVHPTHRCNTAVDKQGVHPLLGLALALQVTKGALAAAICGRPCRT